MRPRRPSLQDVADLAKTTKMTVSRCLRKPDSVSEGLRRRIQGAIEEVGYIPNRGPEMLARARSHSIGLLVPSITNQVFSDVIMGISEACEQAGYHYMIAHYSYSRQLEERNLRSILSYNVDGLILSESDHTDKTRRMIEVAGIPTIEIMDTVSSPIHQAIGYDNCAAAREMVAAMIARGRRHILYFAVRLDARTIQREEGYAAALAEHGLEARTIEVSERSSFSMGARMMARVVEESLPCDGIFCTNDDIAIGAYFECLKRGVHVPDDVAIAGFHGHDVGQAMTPRLASVVTPRREIGERAASELLARIKGKPVEEPVIDLGYIIEQGDTI